MSLTLEEIEQIDETMEAILDVVDQETNWKNIWNQSKEEQTCMLNIEGKMRVRISDLLRELIDEQVSESEPITEPPIDPHELD